MRRVQIALGVCAILLLSLGLGGCVDKTGCPCVTSTGASKFAYVMLEFDTIAAFDINGSTGVLTPVNGSPFGGNISPFYGTSDPAGKFLYAVDQNNGRIYGFSIDATTGALTAVPGSPYSPSASQARIPLVDPSGSFLYVTHQDSCGDDCQGAVSAYKINADGSLTEITGSPYSTDYGTFGIAIQPSGKFLYTMNGRNCCRSANTISVFQVDPASGALTPINGSPFTAAGTPFLAAIHPNGNFLYAISGGEGFALVVYSIGASGTPSATSAFYQLGQNPQSLDIDAIDNFLFVGDNGSTGSAPVDGSIRVYRMNAVDGTLMPVTGSPFTTTGSNPLQVAVDRSCRFLYVTNNNPGKGMAADYVLGFAIDPLAGTLTAVPGSPFATPSGGPPQGIVLTPHGGAPTVP